MGPKPKCLVTGAAGFVGSHLVDRLLPEFHVVGLDHLKLGRRANLERAGESPDFELLEADLNDMDRCRDLVARRHAEGPFVMVWHLAANSDIRAGVADAGVDMRDTFLSTHHVLKLMRELGIGRLAFASTSAIYGDSPHLLEEDRGPWFPISNYGAMKLASEAAISAALESFLERAWIFRFPNVVGSRSTHGAIYDFVRKLKANPAELEVLGDGAQEKPYLHVSELIDAMAFIVDRARDRLNYFNIGPAGSATRVRTIAETVAAAMSPQARLRFTGGAKGWVGDVPKFQYAIEKLRRLGWQPTLTSDQAVDRAVREVVAEHNKG